MSGDSNDPLQLEYVLTSKLSAAAAAYAVERFYNPNNDAAADDCVLQHAAQMYEAERADWCALDQLFLCAMRAPAGSRASSDAIQLFTAARDLLLRQSRQGFPYKG